MGTNTAIDSKLPYSGRFWTLVAPILRHHFRKLYGAEIANRAYRSGKPIYRELIGRAPAIGAENPMARNLYLACVIFAMWKAADGQIAPDMMREVLRAIFDSKLMRLAGGMGDLRRQKNMTELVQAVHANARWAEEHPSIKDATWCFHFDDERGGTVAHYHYTRCPINDLARQEGYEEILPVMCETDFFNTNLKHGRLTREHTLAEGGPCCDFLIEPGV